MRWGDYQLRFARPIRWIVAVYGNEIIRFNLAGLESGGMSYGHRFMSKGPVSLTSDADEYIEVMKQHHVLVDPDKRREKILRQADAAAKEKSGNLLSDPQLLEINTFLTEFPSVVCGSFNPRFLSLPQMVLITAMKEHQKYFSVVDDSGKIMPYFLAVNNTLSPKPEIVRKGHERVLEARLSDAAFFYEEDKRDPLEAYVPGLKGVVFHQGMGTLFDKTMRVVSISRFLAKFIDPDLTETAERAAYLSKSDLITQMVGEFPSLQGVMGREYAIVSGETQAVAEAIQEHYLPVRSGGQLPKSLEGSMVSIADKADTICATFALGLQPTGAADPYGLRRAALGILHIIEEKELSVSLQSIIEEGLLQIEDQTSGSITGLSDTILDFFLGRFRNDLISRGFQYDIVDAATQAGFGDIVDCVKRIKALKAVRSMPEFEPLSIAFKRVMNILKGFDGSPIDPGLLEEEQEKALYEAYLDLDEKVSPLCDEKEYKQALMSLLSIKPLADAFFDHVMVMVEDDELRDNRLALLWQISRLFLRVGDLSAIVAKETV
jgi:glycyl-tRNA synthetase beta chain